MNGVVLASCLFCATIATPPYPSLSDRAGDIWYTYEMTGRGVHLLRLSTTDLLFDSDGLREQRLAAFAHQFAGRRCAGSFTIVRAERVSWPDVRPVYARQYVFRCISG